MNSYILSKIAVTRFISTYNRKVHVLLISLIEQTGSLKAGWKAAIVLEDQELKLIELP